MTISEEDRETLIKYRIEQAREEIGEVEFLLKNNKLKLAVTRIYYGMFYVLLALALKHKFNTSKHKELIGWFNKNFIKEKKVEQKYGAIVRDAYEKRSDSDYAVLPKFQKADVEKMLADMKDFISVLEKYITGKKSHDQEIPGYQ